MNICKYTPTKYLDDRGINDRLRFLFKNVCYLLGQGANPVFDATVNFSVNADPNTGGTTFSPNTPELDTVIYVSTVDGSQWTWNGAAYVIYTPTVGGANIYNSDGTLLTDRVVYLNGHTLNFVNTPSGSSDFGINIKSFEGAELASVGGSTLQGGYLILGNSTGLNKTTLRTLSTGNRGVNLPDANGTIALQSAASGTFTTADAKTVTVTNGIITSIV